MFRLSGLKGLALAVCGIWAIQTRGLQDRPDSAARSSPTPVRDALTNQTPSDPGADENARMTDADGNVVPRVVEWRHMAARERKAIEQFIEKFFPEIWQEVAPLKESDLRGYNARMEHLARELVPLMDQRRENEGRGDILIREKQCEFRIQELVAEYLLHNDAQRRERIRHKLRELVGRQFDAAQERRRLDVQRLEERIMALKRLIEEKSQNREAIIARQVEMRLNPSAKPQSDDAAPNAESSSTGP